MNIRVITFYFNNVDVVAVRIFPRREGSGESLTEALIHIETVNQSQQLPIYRLLYEEGECLTMTPRKSCDCSRTRLQASNHLVSESLWSPACVVSDSNPQQGFLPLLLFSLVSWSGKLYFDPSNCKLNSSSPPFWGEQTTSWHCLLSNLEPIASALLGTLDFFSISDS